MKRDLRVYVDDVIQSIAKIEEYARGISEEAFCEDTKIQDAVLRRLEVIGEAVKSLSYSDKAGYLNEAVSGRRI